MQATNMMTPIYMGYEKDNESKQDKKKSSSNYDENMKRFLRDLGLGEDEEEYRMTPTPSVFFILIVHGPSFCSPLA